MIVARMATEPSMDQTQVNILQDFARITKTYQFSHRFAQHFLQQNIQAGIGCWFQVENFLKYSPAGPARFSRRCVTWSDKYSPINTDSVIIVIITSYQVQQHPSKQHLFTPFHLQLSFRQRSFGANS